MQDRVECNGRRQILGVHSRQQMRQRMEQHAERGRTVLIFLIGSGIRMSECSIRCFLTLLFYHIVADRLHLLHVDDFGSARELNLDPFYLHIGKDNNESNNERFSLALILPLAVRPHIFG